MAAIKYYPEDVLVEKFQSGEFGWLDYVNHHSRQWQEEFEAFLTIDNPDDTGERFQSPLYTMVKATKMFTLVELRQKQLMTNKTETQEI